MNIPLPTHAKGHSKRYGPAFLMNITQPTITNPPHWESFPPLLKIPTNIINYNLFIFHRNSTPSSHFYLIYINLNRRKKVIVYLTTF